MEMCFQEWSIQSTASEKDTASAIRESDVIALNCLEEKIGLNKLCIFKSYVTRNWAGVEEDRSLFNFWYDLSSQIHGRLAECDKSDVSIPS